MVLSLTFRQVYFRSWPLALLQYLLPFFFLGHGFDDVLIMFRIGHLARTPAPRDSSEPPDRSLPGGSAETPPPSPRPCGSQRQARASQQRSAGCSVSVLQGANLGPGGEAATPPPPREAPECGPQGLLLRLYGMAEVFGSDRFFFLFFFFFLTFCSLA